MMTEPNFQTIQSILNYLQQLVSGSHIQYFQTIQSILNKGTDLARRRDVEYFQTIQSILNAPESLNIPDS